MNKKDIIFVAGHSGMVGSAIVRKLTAEGYIHILTRSHHQLDLCDQKAVKTFFNNHRIEYVFLAAARVGGIHANNQYPAEFIYQNLMIETNIIHAAWQTGVKRLLFLGSSCIYPKESRQPMDEDCLLTGKLEPTNEPYAIAKIAGIKLCESFNRQYGTDYRSVMPTNLYGPNDNYNLETSHVLPAMIRKFHLAKLAERGDWSRIRRDEERYGELPVEIAKDLVLIAREKGHDIPGSLVHPADNAAAGGITLWGTGKPKREFLYVDDLAGACYFVMNLDKSEYGRHTRTMTSHINVGTGKDLSIFQLADTIRRIVGFSGDLVWDTAKPDGTMQKRLEVSLLSKMGWSAGISIQEGIQKTYTAYLESCQLSL